MNLAGFDRPKVYKKKILCLYSPILKVHSTKTSGPLRFSELGNILDPGSLFKDYYLHRVRSLEEKLEDLRASLSLNYWLTKFVQEIANKNEIVNSARGMFTEFKKTKRNWQCS